jgi:RimJ/RimL family protein N-acetyltransferase
MKKTVFLLWTLQTSLHCNVIETERTIWRPWTIEHTHQWEEIEQRDMAPSHFRRNEFFENINDLMLRDTNWLTLHDYIHILYGKKTFFPDLGFAIIRKTDQQLIGTIRIKLKNQPEILSFAYALRPEVRNCKFGQEIIKAFTKFIDQLIEVPTLAFKNGINKNIFMAEWRTEGKKENPNFDHLISFFSPISYSFQKIVGSVDAKNQASLSVLLRNGMQPVAIECVKYIFDDNNNLFGWDILLQYPPNHNISQPTVENFVADVLSRDQNRIDQVHNQLKELFNIPNDWTYLQLTRAEKAALKPLSKTSLVYSDSDMTKKIVSQIYYPPYCFIK